eukprot:scaffold14323_cov62-Phaeocystis_antarctica.AAC.1
MKQETQKAAAIGFANFHPSCGMKENGNHACQLRSAVFSRPGGYRATPLLPFHYPRPQPSASASQRRQRCTSTCTNAEG